MATIISLLQPTWSMRGTHFHRFIVSLWSKNTFFFFLLNLARHPCPFSVFCVALWECTRILYLHGCRPVQKKKKVKKKKNGTSWLSSRHGAASCAVRGAREGTSSSSARTTPPPSRSSPP